MGHAPLLFFRVNQYVKELKLTGTITLQSKEFRTCMIGATSAISGCYPYFALLIFLYLTFCTYFLKSSKNPALSVFTLTKDRE